MFKATLGQIQDMNEQIKSVTAPKYARIFDNVNADLSYAGTTSDYLERWKLEYSYGLVWKKYRKINHWWQYFGSYTFERGLEVLFASPESRDKARYAILEGNKEVNTSSVTTRGGLHKLFQTSLKGFDKKALLTIGNYFTIDDHCRVTYVPNIHLDKFPKMTTPPAKLLRDVGVGGLLTLAYPLTKATIIEDAVNEMKKIKTVNINYEVLEGEDIRKAYLWESHAKRTNIGILRDSCMRYTHCQPFFDIYVDHAKLFVAKNNVGGILGRCLLWTDDEGAKYYDRIYGSEPMIRSMREQIEAMGYKSLYVRNNPQLIKSEITVGKKYDKYPYMDTYCILHENGLKISTQHRDIQGYYRYLRNVNGGVG